MSVKPIPDGYHTITPYLCVRDAAKLIGFLKAGFSAEVRALNAMPDGTVLNAELRIGTSMLMVAEARPDKTPSPTMLYLYVNDADAAYQQALKAGARSVMEVTDQFYGDRSGGVEDANGNQWWLATRKENLTQEQVAERAKKYHG